MGCRITKLPKLFSTPKSKWSSGITLQEARTAGMHQCAQLFLSFGTYWVRIPLQTWHKTGLSLGIPKPTLLTPSLKFELFLSSLRLNNLLELFAEHRKSIIFTVTNYCNWRIQKKISRDEKWIHQGPQDTKERDSSCPLLMVRHTVHISVITNLWQCADHFLWWKFIQASFFVSFFSLELNHTDVILHRADLI
jgi:hypothetical protein